MKEFLRYFLAGVIFLAGFWGVASAQEEEDHSVVIPMSQLPSRSGNTANIGMPTEGWTLLNVQLYKLRKGGIDDLEAVTSFNCPPPENGGKPEYGFNFTARMPNPPVNDPWRGVRWMRIDEYTATGPGIGVDCTDRRG